MNNLLILRPSKILQSIARLTLCLLGLSGLAMADNLPVEAFGRLPAAEQVRLSPDGEYIAYLGNTGGSSFVASIHIESGEKKYLVHTNNQKFRLGWFAWANNKTLLISASYPMQGLQIKYGESRLLKVPADGSAPAEPLLLQRSGEIQSQFQSNVIDMLPDDPDHILMGLMVNRRHKYAVYKVSLKADRKRHLIYSGKTNIGGWMTDQQHRVRVGFGRDDTRMFTRLLDLNSNKWRNILEYELFSEPEITPLGFGLDPDELYIRADNNGRYGIFKLDLTQPDFPRELVFHDPDYDVEGRLIYSDKTGDVIGVYHGEADGAKVYFDSSYRQFQLALDSAIPDAYNAVASYSADERKYVLFTSNSVQPGAYYLGNRDTKKLSFLLDQYPMLYQQALSDHTKITYQARDNTEIEGYVTLPHQGIRHGNPAIVMPHGGPMARNYGGFSWFTQFFASRGYVILQPNFRGSSGYGFEFEMASVQGWGGAMQDDLADGAQWLVENYSVDRDRICILGSSYGGYAALMAAVIQQDSFKCAASFAGVSDVEAIVRYARRFSNYEVVAKQFGDNRRALAERSPLKLASQIDIPVLLLHGDKDLVVDVSQSRNMYKALQKHNKQVEYIELENGSHYMEIEANRLAILTAFEAFLDKHLAPDEN